jgi:tetratricopeptide (TPR) repeat protein
MKKAAAAVLLAALAAAAQAGEGVARATLENGVSLGFALVRTGAPERGGVIGEAALPRSNSVSRVLWDRESGAYFGYRVEVERRDGLRPFHVQYKPLDRAAFEHELKQRTNCPGCPSPAPLGMAGPQFPPAQQLAEGEALTLELLANYTTGERIFDVVKLSSKTIPDEAMNAAASRVLGGQQAVRRAEALAARRKFDAAAEEYRKAVEALPNDASVHNKLGVCYQRLQNDAMARKEWERALELNPAYAEAWNNIGTFEHSRKRFKQAVRAYRKAIEIKPALASAWKNLGIAYLALEQIPQAFEAFQEVFRIDPTILESQGPGGPAGGIDAATQNYYLAKMLATNGQKEAALEFLRRAKEAGFHDFRRVESDSVFRAVVQDPRYRELAQQR